MEIKEFQQKLGEILDLAKMNGRKIRSEVVEKFFSGQGLENSQIEKVYDYLILQGIQVEGRASVPSSADAAVQAETPEKIEEETEATEAQPVPLTDMEKEYLADYQAGLADIPPVKPGEKERLFAEAVQGKEEAKKRLAELYMPAAVETAKELKHEEIFIGDMISEGNIGLLMGLERLKDAQDMDAFLRGEIKNAILFMLEEQTELKQQDEVLVEKVRDLETRIKELLEDEEAKYSVEELSAFLDMDVEEIKAVLSLTGDDK